MVKTTFEMDGLFAQEDIDNRHYLMIRCYGCNEWIQWDMRTGQFVCPKCKCDKYDRREARSIRSWLVTKDLKTTKSRKRS